MKKLRKLATIPLLIIGVLIFGAWTPNKTNESIRYVGAPIVSTRASETIYFTSREISEQNHTPNNTPLYRQLSGYSNSCGAVAGSIIVGYYDKYFTNLIPDWDSYYSTGAYRLQDNKYVPDMMRELYALNIHERTLNRYVAKYNSLAKKLIINKFPKLKERYSSLL